MEGLCAPISVAEGRFKLENKLGEGSFGMVFRGSDTQTGRRVAVKLEFTKSSHAGQLIQEASIMNILMQPTKRDGFSNLFYFGTEDAWSVLVMDLLGPSLQDGVDACGGKLDIGTTAIVAEQTIQLIAYLHSRHIRCTRGNDLTGTARYASIGAMRGYTQSRRDDLEAVGHMFIYLALGALPWSGLQARSYTEKLQMILFKKRKTRLSDLCGNLPCEFQSFLRYCRELRFEARPDYDGMQALFRSLRKNKEDHQLQWLESKNLDPSSLEPLQLGSPCEPQPEDLAWQPIGEALQHAASPIPAPGRITMATE